MTVKKENELLDDDLFDEEDTQKDKFLTFHLAGEDYGIPISFVTEIIGIQNITEVPDMPHYMRGVINLRGNVIPVIDVRSRFELETMEYGARTCIIVVNIDNMAIGLIVDQVSEVADIPEADIEPPPQVSEKYCTSYLDGIGKIDQEVKMLLNMNKLLNDQELSQMNA